MEITGKIIAALGERSGTSARTGAEWKVASFVLETAEQYPRKVCFDVFGADRIETMNIQAGEMLTVKFDIDAHAYNGRWFNSVRAYAVSRATSSASAAPVAQPYATPQPDVATQAPSEAPEDDSSELPF